MKNKTLYSKDEVIKIAKEAWGNGWEEGQLNMFSFCGAKKAAWESHLAGMFTEKPIEIIVEPKQLQLREGE